jgi:hypothetical protein
VGGGACNRLLFHAPRTAGAALWFLAIAAIANGIGHPAMSLAVGGYFPGLFTAYRSASAGFGSREV